MAIIKGQPVISRASYQARGFLLEPGEALPASSQEFQVATHAPRLVQINKGDRLVAAMAGAAEKLYVRVERDGQSYACVLLPDSFDLG